MHLEFENGLESSQDFLLFIGVFALRLIPSAGSELDHFFFIAILLFKNCACAPPPI